MKTKTEIQYFYNEVTGKMDRKVITETTEGVPCGECGDGELLTGEVELVDGPCVVMAVTTLAVTVIGVCAAVISNIFRRK